MRSLRRLLALARPNLGAFGRVAALGFAISALYVVSAVLIARTLADLLTGSDLAGETPLLLGAFGALLLRAVALRFQDGLAASAAAEVKLTVRDRLYAQLLDLGPDWLTHTRTGVLQSTVTDGVERLERVYSRLLAQTGVSFTVGLAITGYVIALDPVVGGIVLGCLLALPAMVILLKVAIRSSGTFWWGTYSEMYAEYLDSIQGMPTLKVFGASRRRGEELSTRADRLRDAAIRLATGEISLYLLVYAAVGVATALVLGIGALRVADGAMAGTDLVLVLLLVRECFRPANELLAGFHAAYYGLIAAKPMFELLDTVVAVRDPERPAAASLATPPALRLERVSFTYPRGSHPALDGFDLELPAGATTALVGRSGAGKSTCANLLLRFHDPQAGRITIGGVDLRELTRVDLRARIALVSQDCVLFHGTVRDNLLLARPGGDDRELWVALAEASAAEFVRALPDRLDTVLGERGVTVSGGERQRLAIARALLKDAPVLVLDEATSSLDARNEAIVQRALDRLRRGRTTLIIAHRLSTVANADVVAVLEAGRVVELGTPARLASAGGRYADLQAAQLRAAERVAASGRAS